MKKMYLKPEIDATMIAMTAIMAGSKQVDVEDGEEDNPDGFAAKGSGSSIWPE